MNENRKHAECAENNVEKIDKMGPPIFLKVPCPTTDFRKPKDKDTKNFLTLMSNFNLIKLTFSSHISTDSSPFLSLIVTLSSSLMRNQEFLKIDLMIIILTIIKINNINNTKGCNVQGRKKVEQESIEKLGKENE